MVKKSSTEIDSLFAEIMADGEAAQQEAKHAKLAKMGIHILTESVKEGMTKLQQGVLPGGWQCDGLELYITTAKCETCELSFETMNPAQVFITHSVIRRPDIKHQRPLRPGEIRHFREMGMIIQAHHDTTSVPFCPVCLGKVPIKPEEVPAEVFVHETLSLTDEQFAQFLR